MSLKEGTGHEIDARFDGCRSYVLRGSSSNCGVSEPWCTAWSFARNERKRQADLDRGHDLGYGLKFLTLSDGAPLGLS